MKRIVIMLLFASFLLGWNNDVNGLKQEKVLTLSEDDGHFAYSLEDNRFITLLDMIPGQEYDDHLKIVNECKDKSFTLYFKVVPVEQTSIADKVLEYISMDIVYDNELLYSGRATGQSYKFGDKNLQDKLIDIGQYKPGEVKHIDVHIRLDNEFEEELLDLESRVNWQFVIVLDNSHPDIEPPVIPVPPVNTSDTNNVFENVVMCLASGSLMCFVLLCKKDKKEEMNE